MGQTAAMEKIRTFVAIELPEEVKEKIFEVQNSLRQERADVTWVRREGMHLTLKFLGDVEVGTIDAVAAAVTAACRGTKELAISVEKVGGFPNLRRPRVLWVGMEEPTGELQRLQAKIETELASLGFEKEKRKFSPHLTIGRVKSPSGIDAGVK